VGTPRKLARALLRAAVRLAPLHAAEWAQAMLNELEFVPGEWGALWWALGGAAAILGRCASNWQRWLMAIEPNREGKMNSKGKKAIGVASGAVSALALAGCAFALLRLADLLFPSLGIAHLEWTHWVGAILLPELVFVAAAFLLWRKRGPVAAGILLVAVVIALHFLVHIAAH
jgi:hypothetical protein